MELAQQDLDYLENLRADEVWLLGVTPIMVFGPPAEHRLGFGEALSRDEVLRVILLTLRVLWAKVMAQGPA